MNWNEILEQAPQFFLIFARIFALLSVAPLVSSSGIPGLVRSALALMTSFVVFPVVTASSQVIVTGISLLWIALLIGEILIGLIYGFLIQLVYSAFQTAGQFFSMQMGFGASQVFDPLAQVEVPLMGQFFNLAAMFIFLTTQGMQKLFIGGIQYSFRTIRAQDFLLIREGLMSALVGSVGKLFQQALVLSFPILGTLFLVSLTMGLLAKAAPQMNLLMLGFPIAIFVAFMVIFIVLPPLMDTFGSLIEDAFRTASFLLRIPSEVTP
ncbi:flagellar biosynthetic protein FliR [Spirochaeta lutea]|uniref:Flagellar biosynthetic protein FliR n=1 Tax=Spirochaeta lutea TaxID=1480694 RepID=A0A098R1H9_9SPIO|nr:flagellar biosynthetic protein FliR [Spirochaeta lutea]KGE73538.1 flagellar biosynthesis protein FliR [Spirochaeta lutea]